MGAQASVLGNHQIAVLDFSTEEADGPGCTVGKSLSLWSHSGCELWKKFLRGDALWFIHSKQTKWKRQCWKNREEILCMRMQYLLQLSLC